MLCAQTTRGNGSVLPPKTLADRLERRPADSFPAMSPADSKETVTPSQHGECEGPSMATSSRSLKQPAMEYGRGEVRFENAHAASQALQKMSGACLKNCPLTLENDPRSRDMTKLIISGIPAGTEWQDLKDHFAPVGKVAFVKIKGGKQSGPKLQGEVRFDTSAAATEAMSAMQSCEFEGGKRISITRDPTSKDETKLLVSNLPPGTGWQELKDHFQEAGHPTVFACIVSSNASGPCLGEVRYDNAEHAKEAMTSLNGSQIGNSQVFVMAAPGSVDGTKLVVQGLAPGTPWQEVKDHFAQIGPVAFCQVVAMPKLHYPGSGMAGMGKQVGVGTGMVMVPVMVHVNSFFSKGGKACQMGKGKGKSFWGGGWNSMMF
eukprot:TRINITY_DN5435_c0_g2_i1.p1 TRINITY_DN5435_c0_g2~~TRINITY_DN5435_c0_g2_i1.p1  ORF type:complete len:375 (-),score=66.26 TRINITY_DN5435_c0_g2_i1:86-1210(-)